jgi:Ca2+-binding RTX toxin-like protein
VIFGGAGDDLLTGAAGNDFLIGGSGKDRIVGSAGNDILVSGGVDCVFSLEDLREISHAWASSRSVEESSVDDLIDETLGDEDSDRLTGSSGADLFIINTGDIITDFRFGQPQTNKDGDVVIVDGVVVT